MSKNIAFLGKLPPPNGGVTIHCFRLFKKLHRIEGNNVVFYSLNKGGGHLNDVVYVSSFIAWFFKNIFKKPDYEILHYQLRNYLGLVCVWLISVVHKDVKIAFTLHAPGFFKRLNNNLVLSKLIGFVLKKYDRIVVGNDALKDDLFDYGIDNNVVKIDAFLMPEEDEGGEVPVNIEKICSEVDKVIVANGYNVMLMESGDHYGYDVLAELASKLNDTSLNYHMVILISEVNNPEYINSLFKDLSQVTILSDQNVPGWKVIAKADLMIRPSFSDISGFSLKEAMVNDVYAIASDTVPRYDGVELYSYGDNNDLFNKTVSVLLNNKKPNVEIFDNVIHYNDMYHSM